MATVSLPRSRRIEVSATVNASAYHQVEVLGPGLHERWAGSGEGQQIGEAALEFPAGGGDVSVEVKLSHRAGDEPWNLTHEKVTEERERGEIHVFGEDGRGALDGNDVVVRFRWVV